MQEPTVLTYCKFNSNNVVFYPSFELFNKVRIKNPNSMDNLKNNRVKGVLSPASARKIKNMVWIWVSIIQSKISGSKRFKYEMDNHISFITLTLPSKQKHTDLEIKRLALNRFLIYLQKHYGIKTFIWKAEAQDNGNIHFHILVNKFVKWQEIRTYWNGLMNDLGYIEPFQKKYGHNNPNSIDVHGLYKDKKGKPIGNIGGYLAKYMGKNEDLKRGIDGRLWGCSDNIKNLIAFKILVDGNWTWRVFLNELSKQSNIDMFEKEYFLLLSGTYIDLLKNKYPVLYQEYQNHYLQQYNAIYF